MQQKSQQRFDGCMPLTLGQISPNSLQRGGCSPYHKVIGVLHQFEESASGVQRLAFGHHFCNDPRCGRSAFADDRIVGGFAQGLGGALYEEFLYNERGDPLSTSFADYLMPSARETPRVEVILTEEAPSPLNPLGIKGAGESGITPVGAVIAAAVEAAIGMPGAIKQLPITPQRLKHILDGRR